MCWASWQRTVQYLLHNASMKCKLNSFSYCAKQSQFYPIPGLTMIYEQVNINSLNVSFRIDHKYIALVKQQQRSHTLGKLVNWVLHVALPSYVRRHIAPINKVETRPLYQTARNIPSIITHSVCCCMMSITASIIK